MKLPSFSLASSRQVLADMATGEDLNRLEENAEKSKDVEEDVIAGEGSAAVLSKLVLNESEDILSR